MSSRKEASLAVIPQDVLLRCVAEYLEKREKYKLFSLCTSWKSLLYQCRTIHIIDDTIYRNIQVAAYRCFTTFDSSAEHRLELFKICGINNVGDNNVAPPVTLPFRLTIKFSTLKLCASQILHHINYFYELNIICPYGCLSPLTISKPTTESFTRYLQSETQQLVGARNLDNVWEAAQRISHSSLTEVAETASPSSLRGVHRLLVSWDGCLYVEMSPTCPNAKLQCVTLQECSDFRDVTSLQRVPEVALLGVCRNNHDVSVFAHLDSVSLMGLHLPDISMLGGVRKLTVQFCDAINYFPVPTMGAMHQEWVFKSLGIGDVSALATVENLTLEDCKHVTDISMLGNVKYLTITNCRKLRHDVQFPTPLGFHQQWTFAGISMKGIPVRKFNGLHSLKFDRCTCVALSGIASICKLELIESTLLRPVIDNISVSNLSLLNCHSVLGLGGNVKITSQLQIIAKHDKPFILTFAEMSGNVIHSLGIRNQYGHFIFEHCQDFFQDAKFMQIDANSNYYQLFTPSEAMSLQSEVFDSNSLCTAVEFWCADPVNAIEIYGDIATWNVSQVTYMRGLFARQPHFNSNISLWDVSNVWDMGGMFSGATAFNHPLGSWNVSNNTNTSHMFKEASSFNQPLSSWNVSNVTNLDRMFYKATSFNQPLDNWNVSNVTNMSNLFYKATSFNQPLDNWNVSNVTSMSNMFQKATSFNQPLDNWNVRKVNNMTCMFKDASSFTQPLNSWRGLLDNKKRTVIS